jgi:protein-tyrosine phosphatase
VRVLFVCLGNICRSPTAEGVMAKLVEAVGLKDDVQLDSAGTGGWHIGSSPAARASAAAAARGITLDGAARQITARDFEDFDLILAMDRANLRDLQAMAPPGSGARIRLLREFDPASVDASELDVPDPYYSGADGFEEVLDLVQGACDGLLREIRAGTFA